MATKTKTETKAAAGKRLTVIQVGSECGQKPGVSETLRGLGLGRVRRRRELEDTPEVRGMINRVRHIVRVEE